MASLTLCKSIIAPRLAAAQPSVLMAQKTRQPSTSVLRSLTASRASALLLMGASMVYPKRQLREGRRGVKKVMVMASEEEGLVEEEEEEEEEEGSGFEEKIEENEFAEYPEEAKLFVGNLPLDVDNQQLGELFEAAGEVVDVNIILDRETGNSRGFGFVAMATVEEANKGIEKFNQYTFRGRLLTVNTASPRGTRPERPNQAGRVNRIYVGNLPWQADDNSLLQLFSEHGKVLEAKVVYDRETGRSRGFGFVTLSSESELNDAIAALDGADMDGRPLRVNMAEDRPRRRF